MNGTVTGGWNQEEWNKQRDGMEEMTQEQRDELDRMTLELEMPE